MGPITFAAAFNTRRRSWGSACGSATALCTTSRTNLRRACSFELTLGFVGVVAALLVGLADDGFAPAGAAWPIAPALSTVATKSEKSSLKLNKLQPLMGHYLSY